VTLNPHSNDSLDTVTDDEVFGVESGSIVSTTTPDPRTDVSVEPTALSIAVGAELAVSVEGDAYQPTVGTRVLLAYRESGPPLVVNTRYGPEDAPDVAVGERRLGHPTSDANVTFANDGSVTVTADSGATTTLNADGDVTITASDGTTVEVTSNGTVVVDGGSKTPITDIQTNTDSDGHVTGIQTTTSSSVFLP